MKTLRVSVAIFKTLSKVNVPDPNDPVIGTSAPSDFIVPIVTSTPDADGLVYHEVQYGQTLWAIAIVYGVKIDEIRALNNLGPTTDIFQGDRLLVKKDAPPVPLTAIFEISKTPTQSHLVVTASSFATVTQRPTETSTGVATITEAGFEKTGLVIGIALMTILFAGLLSWISSRRAA
jgi:LysM repeat protein